MLLNDGAVAEHIRQQSYARMRARKMSEATKEKSERVMKGRWRAEIWRWRAGVRCVLTVAVYGVIVAAAAAMAWWATLAVPAIQWRAASKCGGSDPDSGGGGGHSTAGYACRWWSERKARAVR